MTIVRRLARPLLAAPFVSAGADAALHPAAKAEGLRPLVQRAAPPLRLPQDPEVFARANGAVMAGAGVLLALGRLPRLSSLALVATLVPTTYAEHAFWQEKDPQARRAQRAFFLRNAGLLGGALLALVDTEGRPGLAWRGRRAVKKAEKAGKRAAREARRTTREARKSARLATNVVQALPTSH
jgi:putative oxidoreductase